MKKRHLLSIVSLLLIVSPLFAGKVFHKEIPKKIPVVYSSHYNIGLLGLEKLHPFDTKKYQRVSDYLVDNVGIDKRQFHSPEKVSETELLKVHSQEYLNSLKKTSVIARIAEVPLDYVPLPNRLTNWLLQKFLLDPARYATAGTVLATKLSLEHGWAINLSGGYHHAKGHEGSGFCFFADIPLAAQTVLEQHPEYKIMIVDLDAHQGNGHEDCCKNDERVFIFDIYNNDIFPHDLDAQEHIDFNYPVQSGIQDEEYLTLLQEKLPEAIAACKPDLIIYNAGTDVFEQDHLGCMKITDDGIIKRDDFVFSTAREKEIPVVMVLSGGYTKESALIIARSIENIFKKHKLVPEQSASEQQQNNQN